MAPPVSAICLLLAICLPAALHVLRVHVVSNVRWKFMDTPELYPEAFAALPSFDDMIRLRHWSRWTFRQWRSYALERACRNDGDKLTP